MGKKIKKTFLGNMRKLKSQNFYMLLILNKASKE